MEVASRHVLILALALRKLLEPSFNYDEGFANVNAMRIGNGEWPYLDFWTVYGPANSWMLRGLHAITGENLLASRLLDVVICWGLLHLMVKAFSPKDRPGLRWLALAMVSLIFMGSHHMPSYAMTPTMLLCVVTLLLLRKVVDDAPLPPSQVSAWLLGGLIIMTSLFRQDVGAYLLVSCLVAVLAVQWDRLVQTLVRFAVPVACLGLLAWGALLATHDPLAVIQHLLIDPATVLQTQRKLPLPDVWSRPDRVWLSLYGAPTLLVGTLLSCWRAWLPSQAAPAWRASLAFCITLGLLLILQTRSRADVLHATPSLYWLGGAVLICLQRVAQPSWAPMARWGHSAATAATLALSAGLVLAAWNRLPFKHGCQQAYERASCVQPTPGQAEMVALVRKVSKTNEPIFVANRTNQNIGTNDVLFYFLAGRPVASRWHEMHPGIATERANQLRMIQDLEKKKVQTVVLVNMPPSTEPNASRWGGNGTELDAFIAQHFKPVTSFGRYQLLQRAPPALTDP